MFADFKQGKIFYSVTGKGNAVVLIHGFLESEKMWSKQINRLSKTNKVITIDLPGHGQSDNFGYAHPMELMAEAVYSVLKKLRLRRVILIGHSMGGYVSLAFARMFPQMIKGLCLFHSTALPDSDERIKQRNRTIELVKYNKQLYINESIPNLFTPDFKINHRQEIDFAKELATNTTEQGIIAAIEGMKIRASSIDLLKKITTPVGFIIGKKDTSILYESILSNQSNLPQTAYTLLLENVAHMGHSEATNDCNKFLIKFINACHKLKK
ncbi:MAG: alpha/beta hydrolase [Bacteroidia bacterium]|nr:alpha/beta hydrolase [Bacteroidia bacterium]